MQNLTVHIQAISNNFLPPPHSDNQIQALAQDTETRVGYLRQEFLHAMERGNAALSGRFQLLGGWCQEIFNCQQHIKEQFGEVHKFCADVVDNLRTQAAFVSGLLQAQQTDKTWKEEAEATIKQIQKAGNELEKKVQDIQDCHTLVRLD